MLGESRGRPDSLKKNQNGLTRIDIRNSNQGLELKLPRVNTRDLLEWVCLIPT